MDRLDRMVDLRHTLDSTPMTRGQIHVVALAVLLAALDGYDVMSMAFAAPAVSQAWGIDKASLGLVLASSLLGMAGGSLGLSPLADKVGRRPIVLSGVFLMTLGSLLSAVAHNVMQLSVARIVTGVGIGVLVALTTSIAAEFSNIKRRSLSVSATTVGFSSGGMFGGFGAAVLLDLYGWNSVFLFGAVGGAALLLMVALYLPESPAFLVSRRPEDALIRLNRVLKQLGRDGVASLPQGLSATKSSYRALFGPELGGVTLRFALVNLLVTMAAFYVISWMPQLVAEAGFRPSTATMVASTANLVAMPSGILLGLLAGITGARRLASGAMIGLALAIVAFGVTVPTLPLLLASACAFNFFLAGCTGVFYASLAATFPPEMRTSGVGFVLGIGRLSSALGPAAAGWMFNAGLTRLEVSLIFALSACLGGVLLGRSVGLDRKSCPDPSR